MEKTTDTIESKVTWKKVDSKNFPDFNKSVIGLQLPDKLIMVKLLRIDETGPVFVEASYDSTNIFNVFREFDDSRVKLDYIGTFEIPTVNN
jgi:hypothetical protein